LLNIKLCPSKSPVGSMVRTVIAQLDFHCCLSSLFSLIIPAIGAIFLSISAKWLCNIYLIQAQDSSNTGVFFFEDTDPFKPIEPQIWGLCIVTFSSLTINFPPTSLKVIVIAEPYWLWLLMYSLESRYFHRLSWFFLWFGVVVSGVMKSLTASWFELKLNSTFRFGF
jgi:hypothetical protein